MICSERGPVQAGAMPTGPFRGLLAVICLAILAACASAPLGLQKDGSYILDSGEQNLDCDKLYKNIWGHVQIIKGLPEKVRSEQQKSPPTALLAFGRIFGSADKGLVAFEEYDRERAHVYALHRAMLSKKCVPLDLDAELALTDIAMAELRKR